MTFETVSYLSTPEDFAWLLDVHKVDASGYAIAILIGNEDCPSRVDLYKENHYQCEPVSVDFH